MPKPKERHKHNRLTDLKVRKLSEKGRYGDGLGLYLVVTQAGTKQWLLRIMVNGKRKDIGLGGYPTTSLADARKTTLKMRGQAKQGLDPVFLRRDAKRVVPTFEEAARKVHSENKGAWKETKAVAQWISALERYAFPVIGRMRVNDIRPSDIISVLLPIWVEKHSTANRVRQRMSRVFDWAKTQEYLDRDNPVSGIKQGLPRVQSGVKHFRAMSYEILPDFISHLLTSTQSINVKLGMEFLILTCCRSGELRFAEWSEIDLEARRWTIPAERMKTRKEHAIPLTERALAILGDAKSLLGDGNYIFPSSQNWTKPMSDATLSKALKKGLGYDYTIHGFRSTFRDWASETRTYPNDVVEMVLAHANRNKTEASYKRGDLFAKRKVIMADWASYCDGEQ
jgi:integrase